MNKKTCTKCLKEMPIENFYNRAANKDGHSTQCKSCENAKHTEYENGHKELRRKINTEYVARNPEKLLVWQHHTRLKKYAITEDHFSDLLKTQGGVCAICGDKNPRCVDHNHVTGKVRGLLCMPCNFSIGTMQDSPERLRKAASYLEIVQNVT